jgi:hypothetical protein
MVFTQSQLRELVQAELPKSERASLVVLVNTRFSDVQQALEGVEECDAASTLQACQRQIAGEFASFFIFASGLTSLVSVLSCPYQHSTVEVQEYDAKLPVTTASTGSSSS